MTKEDRIAMENDMGVVFEKLIADPNYGGAYHSITPGHVSKIEDDKYNELVKAHIMFKDMSKDSFLLSAGISEHWPHGRGCYHSDDK